MRRLTIVSAAVVLAACVARKAPPAPQPGPVPNPTPSASSSLPAAAALVDHTGDSVETAVSVPREAPNDGIDFENNWIFDRYGRFRRRSWGVAHAGDGSSKRMYQVVKVELADHTERTVYFDITENWNAWRPPAK
jgi:hypothetical protein